MYTIYSTSPPPKLPLLRLTVDSKKLEEQQGLFVLAFLLSLVWGRRRTVMLQLSGFYCLVSMGWHLVCLKG